MPARPGYHLAELNAGRLVAPTDDRRVADFMAVPDRINGLGKRMPGLVRMMAGTGLRAKVGGGGRCVTAGLTRNT